MPCVVRSLLGTEEPLSIDLSLEARLSTEAQRSTELRRLSVWGSGSGGALSLVKVTGSVGSLKPESNARTLEMRK